MAPTSDTGSQTPRRPARARDLWLSSRARRIALTWVGVAVVVAVAIPLWGWVRFRISAWEAYRAGQAGARQTIATGDVQSIWWSDPNGEVFVDPTNGLHAPQATMMMMECIPPSELDLEWERGYRDELSTALASGITLGPDLRPRLRDRAAASELIASSSAFEIESPSGRRDCPEFDRVLMWSGGDGTQVVIGVHAAERPHAAAWSASVATPARAALADDGATLLIQERTGAIQVIDLEHLVMLAWYDGPFASAGPR